MINSFPVVSVIILSVLLFGSIEAWAFAIAGTFTVLSFSVWLYRRKEPGLRFVMPEGVLHLSIIGFFLVGFFQIIPLPAGLIKALSPATYSLVGDISLPGRYGSISFYRYETLKEMLRLSVYLMVFVMAASVSEKSSIRRIMVWLVIFGFLLSVFAIIQKAAGNGKIYWFRELTMGGDPFGPFVNRNHFAGFIGTIIPLGLALTFKTRRAEKAALYAFFTIVMMAGLFYSLSRGGIVSFIISASFFSVLAAMKSEGKKRILLIGAFAFSAALYLVYLGISPVIERFDAAGLSSSSRLLVWKGAVSAFRDFPVFGTGLGTFRYIFQVYQPEGVKGYFEYAHNDYLQLLLEAGIAGAAFATMFVISMGFIVVKYIQRHTMGLKMAGLISSMLYMLVHSAFDFNFHMPSNAITFSAVMGLTYSLAKSHGAHKQTRRHGR